MSQDSDKLWDCLCCCGDDHKVREGGSHINLVQLRKLAKWPYLASVNFLVPESANYPLANAVVCDQCLKEKQEIKYAMAGVEGGNGAEYYRVPLSELEEPKVYWPDLHPDKQPKEHPANVCCPLFLVLPCADTDDHQHIGCDALAKVRDDPIITNEHAMQYCIRDEGQFKHCPYYPKYG